MAENVEVIKDPFDGQLPWDVVGAIEHHIRMLEVPMTNLREHPTEPIGIHDWRGKGPRETRKGGRGRSKPGMAGGSK